MANEILPTDTPSEVLAKDRANRTAEGTTAGSTFRVENEGKSSRKNNADGSASMNKNNQTRTNFIPSTTYSPNAVAPDFYRNGVYANTTENIAGEQVERQRWNPLPELMAATSDDYNGVLASIKLIDPKKVRRQDNGALENAGLIPEFSKFFLESVQENHQEKYQVVETFNDFYAFFYGERPPVYTFSGHLLNLKNYNWMNEFLYYYNNFWRGTKTAELGARVFITYNYQQIQGYVLGVSTNVNAITDKAAPFNIQVLVTKRLIFSGDSSDDLVKDSLLPQPDSGFLDITASTFASAFVKEYLEGTKPASGLSEITDTTKGRGISTVAGNNSSTPIDKFAGGNPRNKKWVQSSTSELAANGTPTGTPQAITRGARRAGAQTKDINPR